LDVGLVEGRTQGRDRGRVAAIGEGVDSFVDQTGAARIGEDLLQHPRQVGRVTGTQSLEKDRLQTALVTGEE
jgi:hypothetical protein